MGSKKFLNSFILNTEAQSLLLSNIFLNKEIQPYKNFQYILTMLQGTILHYWFSCAELGFEDGGGGKHF